ncbi:hypothetical protein B5X24_HaOG200743, partial [Helicoverpa armigera]
MCSYFKEYFESCQELIIIKDISPEADFGNNIVDEDLQSILRPLNLMQSLFLSAKYCIRDKNITSTTRFYTFLRIIFVLVHRCFQAYQIIVWNTNMFNENSTSPNYYSMLYLCIASTVGFFIYFIGDVISIISNIVFRRSNILLVLKIQHVFSFLRLNRNEIRGFIVSSWVLVIVSNVMSLSFVVYYVFTFAEVHFITMFTAYASISFEINVLYAFILLKLTENMLREWIKKFEATRNIDDSEKLFQVFGIYWDTLEIYMIIEKTFQHMVW